MLSVFYAYCIKIGLYTECRYAKCRGVNFLNLLCKLDHFNAVGIIVYNNEMV
jgi:hypothetical protein